MLDTFQVSERRACEAAKVYRSLFRYQPQADDQAFLRKRIREIAAVRMRYGYKRIHVLLRRDYNGFKPSNQNHCRQPSERLN